MPSTAEKRLADHYSEEGTGTSADLRNSTLIALVLPKVVGTTVLDIGCGSGFLLGELAKKGKRVFGVEPNHELATLLRKRYPAISIAEKTVESLEEVPGVFDTITLLDVLEHVEDDVAALHKIYKKLVPGGQLVLVVPAHQILYGKRDVAMGHYRRYGKEELFSKISSVGFTIQETRHWNALAFLPYWFAEKILHRELVVSYRANKNVKGAKKSLRRMISWWLASVEHFIDFRFGLSLIIIAKKPLSTKS
ncbi:MAG: class I SAM-dependent methyltransferase [Patescibacteria group bacterium]|nr:class I SAM-dependent methyltransferase [Patescibacteria group bacterium]